MNIKNISDLDWSTVNIYIAVMHVIQYVSSTELLVCRIWLAEISKVEVYMFGGFSGRRPLSRISQADVWGLCP